MANTTMTATLKILADVSSAQSSVAKLQQALGRLKLDTNLTSKFKAAFNSFNSDVEAFKTKLQEPITSKKDASGLDSLAKSFQTNFNEILKLSRQVQQEITGGLDFSQIKGVSPAVLNQIKQLDAEIEGLHQEISQLTTEPLKQITEHLSKLNTEGAKAKGANFLEAFKTGDLEKAKIILDQILASYKGATANSANAKIFKEIEGIFNSSFTSNAEKMASIIEKITQKTQLMSNEASQVGDGFTEATSDVEAFGQSINHVRGNTKKVTEAQLEYNRELDSVKHRIKYFFGLENAIQLVKRAIRSAFEAVKELDAAMTETAVVTDFTVGDMWSQLPQYTKMANELGATTLGAYETMTLFYQQGLETNEVFEIGTETMKMARIAGLDYAEATDKMTAALRGFNMELNETSAKRVNDVYSELAAITAADTEEISTAMTKTASIANSANMEFETTAAFLSQIIETTRESAETAGTAMKTVIARFQELKKDPAEIGEVDGEVVDANKIEAALRTVGVSLRDVSGQFRDLDAVFIELASKWDSFDTNTQRYIATIAAGSRQQSRFIAMMSDYDRTMELVEAANNSAGASQQQFEKTLDSLESKLNKLKNAWNEFTMGLMNSDLIKGGVDLLTNILNLFNKITESGNATAGMLKKIALGFGLFKGGKVLANGLFGAFSKETGAFKGIAKGISEQFTAEFSGIGKLFSKEIWTGTEAFRNSTVLSSLREAVGKIDFSQSKEAANSFKEAINNLGFAYTDANQAIKDYNILRDFGLTDQQLAIALNKQETQVILSKILANKKLTDEEKEKILTENVGNGVTKKGIIGKVKNTLATIGESKASLFSAMAKKKETVNQLGLNSAMRAGLLTLGVYTAAAIALGLAIYGIIKYAQNNNLNYQLEQAKKATEAAKESAEEAKQAYDELFSARTEYNEMQAGFEGLIEGTNEWKQSLVEANQAVLDLISTYPELASYMKTGEFGQLTISDEGWEEALDAQYKAVENANQLLLVSSMVQQDLQAQKDFSELDIYYMSEYVDEGSTTESTGIYISAEASEQDKKQILENYLAGASIDDILKGTSQEGTTARMTQKQYDALAIEASKQQAIKASQELANEGFAEAFAATNIDWEDYNFSDQVQSNFIDMIGGSLGKEISEQLKSQIDSTNHSENVADALEDIGLGRNATLSNIGKKNLKEIYAELMNISVDEIPEEIAESKESLRAAIAKIDLGDTFTEGFETILEDISNLDKDSQEILTELFTGSASVLDHNINDIQKAINDYDLVANWEELNTALGIGASSLEDFTDRLEEMIRSEALQLNTSIGEAIGTAGLTNKDFVTSAINSIATWTQAEKGQSLNVTSNLAALGQEAQSTYWQYIIEVDTSEAREEINSFILGIDTSNPIKAFSQLETAINSENEQIREMATNLQEAGDSAFSSASQFKYFLNSADFGEISESLDEFLDETDKISAENIEELADSNENLNGLIENNIISAEGLALVLTKFKTGEIQITNLTDAVIASISKFNNLATASKKAIETMNSFEPSMDESDISERFSGLNESITENLEKGMINNTAMVEEIEFYFGELSNDEAIRIQELERLEWLTAQNANDMSMNFRLLAYGKDWRGNEITGAELMDGGGYDYGGFSVRDTGSEYELDIGTLTESQLTEKIQSVYGGTKEYAALMLAEWRAYDTELDEEIAVNELRAGIAESYASLRERAITDGGRLEVEKFIDESEIQTIADLTGKKYSEVREAFLNWAPNDKITITDFFDENGSLKQGKEFWDQYRKIAEDSLQGVIDDSTILEWEWVEGTSYDTREATKTLDYSSVASALTEATNQPIENLGPQMTEVIQTAAQQGVDAITWDYKGEPLEIPIDETSTVEEITAAMEEAEAQIDLTQTADTFATAFAAALSGVENIEFTITQKGKNVQEQATTDCTTAQTQLDSNPLEVSINTAYSEAELTSQWRSMQAWWNRNKLKATVQTKKLPEGFATGTSYAPRTGWALTGEEGPELWLTDGAAYLLGQEGPQMAPIQKGDTVYTATQTRRILGSQKNSKPIRRFAYGYGYGNAYRNDFENYIGSSSGTGSSSGARSSTSAVKEAKEASEIWENSFDWLYNLTEDINELLREREKLERQYDRILAARNTTAKQLYENVTAQLQILEIQKSAQTEMYDKRTQEMKDYLSKNTDLAKYATYNWEDMTIEIDWDKIDAVTDEDTGEAIEDYVSKLEEIQDALDEAQDEIADIEDQITELLEQGRDEYLDLEKMVFEALLEQKQAAIDAASDISSAISDTNSRLLDSLSNSISQMRDDRELQETEETLAEKQNRLLYLQQDTSGANAMEILKLQQELEDEQQSYTDELIDRKIDELQEQNDIASEQRERQIELAQTQLDKWSESQEKWTEIHNILAAGIDPSGALLNESNLMGILQSKDAFAGMSQIEKVKWLDELEATVEQGLSWFARDQQLESIGVTSGEIEFTTADGQLLKGTVNKDGTVSVRGEGGNYIYQDVFKNMDGSYRTFEEDAAKFVVDPEPPKPAPVTQQKVEDDSWDGRKVYASGRTGLNMSYYDTYYAWEYVYWNGKKHWAPNGKVWVGPSRGNITGKTNKSALTRYKTGGLADYTGPAWLDGTPSHPELVLNAQDTKNFIALRNVLSEVLSTNSTGKNQKAGGDNYYDIDISVESISNDYDVEQVASKIKSMIAQDGLYRNVNTINHLK